MQNISTYFKQPKKLCLALLTHFGTWLPDALYLKIMFRLKMEYNLDLESPKTFNEKLQWLKLYNRKPEYTQMVDKYEVKKLVEKILGKEYVIPTLGVWKRFEDIDFSTLPDRFVLSSPFLLITFVFTSTLITIPHSCTKYCCFSNHTHYI